MYFKADMENNNINFTGIRNLASAELIRPGFKKTSNLSLTLRDDCIGKDLQDFKDVLKRVPVSDGFKNKEFPDALNIECLHWKDGRKGVMLNGIKLDCLNDLPLFSYLAKLTKRIQNMQEMPVDKTYKNFFAKDTLVQGETIDNYSELLEAGLIDNMFGKENVKNAAKKINSFIQNIMEEYLDI